MAYELCRHIKTNGRRCESPALSDEYWCFFHHRLHRNHRVNRAVKPKPKPDSPPIIALPALDDREAIQIGLSVVAETVANNMLDPRRASVLLRALQIASKNAADIFISHNAREIVRSYNPTLDGLALAPRQMSDNSQPPTKPPRSPEPLASSL